MVKLSTIETGFFRSDGGAMFGLLPKSVWSRHYQTDVFNNCTLAMRCLLVCTEERKILFDTGVGIKPNSRTAPYGFSQVVDLRNMLSDNRISPEEITDVVLSHLHFDHCGALTYLDSQDHLCEAFPNATYHISRQQWEHHLAPFLFDKDSYFAENTAFLCDNTRLHLIDRNSRISPEIELYLYQGHTEGQIVSFIHTEEGYVVFAGDVLPLALHLHLDSISAFDNCAATSMIEKKRLIEQIIEKNARVYFYHDAYTQSAKIRKAGHYYRLTDVIYSENFQTPKNEGKSK